MTDARYRLLDTMQDLMSNYLIDECPDNVTWEDSELSSPRPAEDSLFRILAAQQDSKVAQFRQSHDRQRNNGRRAAMPMIGTEVSLSGAPSNFAVLRPEVQWKSWLRRCSRSSPSVPKGREARVRPRGASGSPRQHKI